jgi:hypothetical protein
MKGRAIPRRALATGLSLMIVVGTAGAQVPSQPRLTCDQVVALAAGNGYAANIQRVLGRSVSDMSASELQALVANFQATLSSCPQISAADKWRADPFVWYLRSQIGPSTERAGQQREAEAGAVVDPQLRARAQDGAQRHQAEIAALPFPQEFKSATIVLRIGAGPTNWLSMSEWLGLLFDSPVVKRVYDLTVHDADGSSPGTGVCLQGAQGQSACFAFRLEGGRAVLSAVGLNDSFNPASQTDLPNMARSIEITARKDLKF